MKVTDQKIKRLSKEKRTELLRSLMEKGIEVLVITDPDESLIRGHITQVEEGYYKVMTQEEKVRVVPYQDTKHFYPLKS